MTVNRKAYPSRSIWDAMRQEALVRVGFCCEMCGLPDASEFFNAKKPHPFYAEGTPYRVYLQLAHKRQYETWNREADTVLLCPTCHGRFDVKHRRKPAARRLSSVGLVVVWIWHQGERYLAAEARSFDNLFEAVASFPDGMEFELHPEVLMRGAGCGRYLKQESGITVLQEEGACVFFGEFLEQVLQGVVF